MPSAIFIDGAGRTREEAIYEAPRQWRFPRDKRSQTSVFAPHDGQYMGLRALSVESVAFDCLGQLCDQRYVYGQAGIGLEIFTWNAKVDAAASQNVRNAEANVRQELERFISESTREPVKILIDERRVDSKGYCIVLHVEGVAVRR